LKVARKVALDTNVLVQLFSAGSERHAETRARYQELRESGAEFVLAETVLLEAFSVLSRSPNPVGIPPREAERLLTEHFREAIIAPMKPGFAWEAMRHTLSRGFWGGRVWDTAIAMSVYEAGARLLLTWNVRHFYSVAPVGLEVREP
jgi:predicted nucleic acid-binding protein